MNTYHIINENDDCEYVFTAERTDEGMHYSMRRSGSVIWSNPGERLLTCIDDGNRLIMKRPPKKIGYSDFTELSIFMSAIRSCDKAMAGRYKLLEVVDPGI